MTQSHCQNRQVSIQLRPCQGRLSERGNCSKPFSEQNSEFIVEQGKATSVWTYSSASYLNSSMEIYNNTLTYNSQRLHSAFWKAKIQWAKHKWALCLLDRIIHVQVQQTVVLKPQQDRRFSNMLPQK